METALIVIAVLAWNAMGFYAGVLMVTEDKDFTPDDVVFGLWMGLGGPIILLIVGACALMSRYSGKVLFRKRG